MILFVFFSATCGIGKKSVLFIHFRVNIYMNIGQCTQEKSLNNYNIYVIISIKMII